MKDLTNELVKIWEQIEETRELIEKEVHWLCDHAGTETEMMEVVSSNHKLHREKLEDLRSEMMEQLDLINSICHAESSDLIKILNQ